MKGRPQSFYLFSRISKLPPIWSLLVLLMMIAGLSACQPIPPTANEPAKEPVSEPAIANSTVTFEIDEQGLTAPVEVPAGLVSVVFKNSGQAPHVLFVSWLAEGITAEEVLNAPSEDPSQSNYINGVFLEPGASVNAKLDFTADGHFFVNEVFVENPAFVEFVASGEAIAGDSPSADVTVETVEFSYIMSDTMQAGPQWWQVSNSGTQTHDLGIYKLEGDVTKETLLAQLDAMDADAQLPPPVTTIPSWAVGAGQTTWVQFDLPAGEYVVICRVPDFSTMPPGPDHWHHGMVQSFSVTE